MTSPEYSPANLPLAAPAPAPVAAPGSASTPATEDKLVQVRITFLSNASKVVNAPANSNLLRVSLRERGGIPFKCGGGLCGTCKCRIEQGLENTDAIKPKERNHLSPEQFAQGMRMACQTFVNGDICVSWEVPAKP